MMPFKKNLVIIKDKNRIETLHAWKLPLQIVHPKKKGLSGSLCHGFKKHTLDWIPILTKFFKIGSSQSLQSEYLLLAYSI